MWSSHLDAGGTNLVFGAMQANKFHRRSHHVAVVLDNLDKCSGNDGPKAFRPSSTNWRRNLSNKLRSPARPILDGIIGGYLPNFPWFREGVALGLFL